MISNKERVRQRKRARRRRRMSDAQLARRGLQRKFSEAVFPTVNMNPVGSHYDWDDPAYTKPADWSEFDAVRMETL